MATKQTLNHIADNLSDVIRLMSVITMIGTNNTLQHIQGDEVATLLAHFAEQLQNVAGQLSELTQHID